MPLISTTSTFFGLSSTKVAFILHSNVLSSLKDCRVLITSYLNHLPEFMKKKKKKAIENSGEAGIFFQWG